MTSKNLFFKLMRENLKRRVWLTALSLLLFFFAMPLSCSLRLEQSMSRLAWNTTTMDKVILFFREMLTTDGSPIFIVTCFLAVIIALQGFSYLFSRNKTDLYHGIPTTRAQLFAPIYVNGLILYAAPYLACLLLTLIIGAFYGVCTPQTVFLSLAFAGLHFCGFITLYSAAVVAVMMTGHLAVCIMAVFVFYFYFPLLQFILSAMAGTYFQTFFAPRQNFFTGLHYLSPLSLYQDLYTVTRQGTGYTHNIVLLTVVIAVSSAILTAAALLLYRIRPSEAAGKAMAFQKTKAIIKVLLMVPATLSISGFLRSLTTGRSDVWLVIGVILGLLLSHSLIEIIYEFDFKSAFRHPLSLAVSAGITLAVIAFFRFDLIGFDAYLPDPDAVEYVSIASYSLDNNIQYREVDANGNSNISDLYSYRFSNMRLPYTETIQNFARQGIAFSDEYEKLVAKTGSGPQDKTVGEFVLCYGLKNGKVKYRSYTVDMDEKGGSLDDIYRDPEYKKGVFPILSMTNDQIQNIRFQSYLTPENTVWLNLQDTEKNAILDSYREELLNLSIDEIRKEVPVCVISLPYPNSKPESGDEKEYTPYELINMAKSSAYYVYPSFVKTISLLEQTGNPVNVELDPALISRISIINPALDDADGVYYEEKTAVYTDRDEIEEIFSHLHPAAFSGNGFPLFRQHDMIVNVTYDDKSGMGTIVIPYVFAEGEAPDFVEKDVYREPSGKSSPDAADTAGNP